LQGLLVLPWQLSNRDIPWAAAGDVHPVAEAAGDVHPSALQDHSPNGGGDGDGDGTPATSTAMQRQQRQQSTFACEF